MSDLIQEQLAAARRNQILDAAAKVFAANGFHRTTIKAIAQEAGIADGTIYNYFQNKPALLMGVFHRMREALQPEDPAPPPAQADLHTFIAAFLSYPLLALKDDNFALFRVVVSEMMVNDELRAMYYEQILEPTVATAETHFQPLAEQHAIHTQDVRLLVRVISAWVLGLMMQIVMGDTLLAERWDDLPNFVADVLVNGVERPS